MGHARYAYVFDVWAGVNSDNVAVLHPEVVTNDPVDASAAVVEVIICENDENSVLPLLSLYENCVATEELEGLHGVVGESDDGVVIVGGVGDTDEPSVFPCCAFERRVHIHKRVWLLLLPEDSGRSLVVLGDGQLAAS